MSYGNYPPDDPRPQYQAPPPAYPPAYPPQQPPRRYRDTATIVARVVVSITFAVAFVFALHIFFALANANEGNGIVQFVYLLSKILVLGFGDIFTPDDATIGLVLNYGFAAIAYLVIGQLIARAIRR